MHSMPMPFNEKPKDRLGWTGAVGIFVIPVMVVITIVAIIILDPRAATQISNAVEAEFSTAQAPAPVQSPPSVVAVIKAK